MGDSDGEVCRWDNDVGFFDDTRIYLTACGEEFYLNEGGPMDNGFKFCCFCGKVIEVVGD